jgi:hypothetical protein
VPPILKNVTKELKKWRFIGKNGVKMLTLPYSRLKNVTYLE